jgi:hypothetical protein
MVREKSRVQADMTYQLTEQPIELRYARLDIIGLLHKSCAIVTQQGT